MKFIFSLASLILIQAAHADPQSWMKQENPDSLGLFVSVSSQCPVTHEELTKRVQGEFLRSRIKATKSLALNLTIQMHCLESKSVGGAKRGYSIAYEIRFGTKIPSGAHVLYEEPNFGSLLTVGPDDKQFIVDSIRDDVTRAITDYLKANFE